MTITSPVDPKITRADQANAPELTLVSQHLQDRFSDCADDAQIDAAVTGAARRYDGARIRAFIPILVEHAARSTLLRRRHPPGGRRPGPVRARGADDRPDPLVT
jgi:hypothetical protein